MSARFLVAMGIVEVCCSPTATAFAPQALRLRRPLPGKVFCARPRPSLPAPCFAQPVLRMSESEEGGGRPRPSSSLSAGSSEACSLRVSYPTPDEGAAMGIREWPGTKVYVRTYACSHTHARTHVRKRRVYQQCISVGSVFFRGVCV
jgi:hypothetical protein